MKFKNSSRYAISSKEDYEPGSNSQVLKNHLGITSQITIEQLEAQELKRVELELVKLIDENHQFISKDICKMHQLWLQDIYPFAGQYRTVNMLKGDFLFAAANYIPACMKKFDHEHLAQYSPCHFSKIDELAYALGVVHVEFILIHPFREGNGRIGRLLASLMALQAKKSPLNFITIDKTTHPKGFQEYILAIHAGHSREYKRIQAIFKTILETST